MTHRVLVIAAHPDDEVLGCGGTAALHVRAGHEVTAVIACVGESLRYGPDGVGLPALLRSRQEDRHFRHTRAEVGRYGVLRERGPPVPPSPLARRAAASRARLGQSLLPRRRRGVHDGTTEPPRWPNACLTWWWRPSASWSPPRSCW